MGRYQLAGASEAACQGASLPTRRPPLVPTNDWPAPREAFAGIAMINALGTGCAFVCNPSMGSIYDSTHLYPLAMLPFVAFASLGTVVLLVPGPPKFVAATG